MSIWYSNVKHRLLDSSSVIYSAGARSAVFLTSAAGSLAAKIPRLAELV